MNDEQNTPSAALADLLQGYSVEVTSGDRSSIDAAATLLPRGSEVFIASLPSDSHDRQVTAAVRLKAAGLKPVPHLVARNIAGAAEFDGLLARLTAEAGVDRVLLLGGDREKPAGGFTASADLLRTGLVQRHGISRVLFSWYPEPHPRISAAALAAARREKLELAAASNLHVTLVSQFCFEAAPILETARALRAAGVTVPLRVGVAGPASRRSLLKYALICGVGTSIRALQARPAARGMLAGHTPEDLLLEVARARAAEPALGLAGVHFFTFASPAASAEFAERCRRVAAPA